MKKRPYKLQLQTPLGECEAAADTMPGLVEITPRGLFGEALDSTKTDLDKLDIVSRDLWAAFLETLKNKRRVYKSSIRKENCELDLMRCYLQGFSVEGTADYLSGISGSPISHSAVGRYWKVLNNIGPNFIARL